MKSKNSMLSCVSFFIAFVVLLYCSPSDAAEQAGIQQEWYQVLLLELVKLLSVVAIPVLTAICVSLADRYNLGLQQAQFEKIVEQAIGWAEEKASQALKEGNKKTSGAEKADMALQLVLTLAKQLKLKEKVIASAKDLIDAKLGQKRVDVIKAENAKYPEGEGLS